MNSARPAAGRGMILILVLILIVIVGGTLALMTRWSAQGYQTHQADRARLVARAICGSAAGYARAHLAEWSAHPPAEPVSLDVSALLPPRANGSARIAFLTVDGRRICRVSATAHIGPSGAMDEIEIELPPASRTRPAGS